MPAALAAVSAAVMAAKAAVVNACAAGCTVFLFTSSLVRLTTAAAAAVAAVEHLRCLLRWFFFYVSCWSLACLIPHGIFRFVCLRIFVSSGAAGCVDCVFAPSLPRLISHGVFWLRAPVFSSLSRHALVALSWQVTAADKNRRTPRNDEVDCLLKLVRLAG